MDKPYGKRPDSRERISPSYKEGETVKCRFKEVSSNCLPRYESVFPLSRLESAGRTRPKIQFSLSESSHPRVWGEPVSVTSFLKGQREFHPVEVP